MAGSHFMHILLSIINSKNFLTQHTRKSRHITLLTDTTISTKLGTWLTPPSMMLLRGSTQGPSKGLTDDHQTLNQKNSPSAAYYWGFTTRHDNATAIGTTQHSVVHGPSPQLVMGKYSLYVTAPRTLKKLRYFL